MTDFEHRLAIVDVSHRYCWALDARQWHLLDDVFAADATAELASPLLQGRDAIVARVRGTVEVLDATQHTVTNHLLEIDGVQATSMCYLHAQHVLASAEGGPLFVVAGRYHDRLELTAAGWRIVHRRLDIVWTEGNMAVVRGPRRA